MLPEQCRAARAWLDWSQQNLATRAKVSLSTVRDFEKRRRKPIPNNLAAIQRALEAVGVEFTNGDAPGVRLRKARRR
jgi:ribosome-binding protein aMBF1 (putative translation factor)